MATKDTLPWKLHDGRPRKEGPLGMAHVQALASQHQIDPARLRHYSRDIELAFSREFSLTESRPGTAARKKGVQQTREVSKHLSAAEKELSKASDLLRNVHFKHAYAHTGSPNPSGHYIAGLEEAIEAVSAFQQFLAVMERNDAVVFLGVPDARVLRDQRREVVCWTAFNLWRELERPLTFTTDVLNSQRSGKLFAFVRDVVACLTEPATFLSDAALMSELNAYKDFCAAHRPESTK